MADVTISVIGKDMVSGTLNGIRATVSGLSGEILNLGNRAVTPVTIALGNLFTDVMRNGINALNNLKGTVESFSFIRLNMQMEGTRSSFTTLIGSAEEANATLKILREYANYTPFEFTQLTAATKKMLAFGFSVEEITKNYGTVGTGLLDVIGNAASALGAGQEGIERITRALGQMRGLARVSAEDMNQLIDVGIQGYQILAEQLGMTVKEVRDQMKKGALDAETGITALLNGMIKQYGGGMASFAQTAEGMSSTLNDYIADIQRTFGEMAYKEYRALLQEVTKLVGSPAFTKFAQMLGVQFGQVVQRLNQNILIPAVQTAYRFVDALGQSDEAMQAFFDTMMAKFRPVTDVLQALFAILKASATVVRQFVSAFLSLEGVGALVETLSGDFYSFIDSLYSLADRITVSEEGMQSFAQTVFDLIKPAVDIFRSAIPVLTVSTDIVGRFIAEFMKAGSLQSILGRIISGYSSFSTVLDNLMPQLVDVRDRVPEIFTVLANAVLPSVANVREFLKVMKQVGIGLISFVKSVAGLRLTGDTLKLVMSGWNGISLALTGAMPTIVSVVQRIPEWVAGIDALYMSIRNFLPVLTDQNALIGVFMGVLRSAGDAIKQFVQEHTLIGQVLSVVNKVFNEVTTSVAPYVQFIRDLVAAILTVTGIPTLPANVITGIAKALDTFLASVAKMLPSYREMVNFFESIQGVLGNRILPTVRTLLSEAENVASRISPVLGRIVDSAKNFGSNIKAGLDSPELAEATQGIRTFAGNVVAEVRPLLNGDIFSAENVATMLTTSKARVTQWFFEMLAGGIQGLANRVPEIATYFDTLLPALANGLGETISSVWNMIRYDSTGVQNAAQNLVTAIRIEIEKRTPQLKSPFETVGNEIAGIWSRVEASGAQAGGSFMESMRGICDSVNNITQTSQGIGYQIEGLFRGGLDSLLGFINSPDFDTAFATLVTKLSTALQTGANMLFEWVSRNLAYGISQLPQTISQSAGLVLDYIPTITATLFKIGVQIVNGVQTMVLRTIQGAIEGILTGLGLEEFVPQVSAFFDELVGSIENQTKMITESVNSFVNWWSSLELGTKLATFGLNITNFITNTMPRLLNLLGQVPQLLISSASALIGDALNGMLTMIQGVVNNLLDALGLSGLKDVVGEIFGEWRASIDKVTTSASDALSGIRSWWGGLTDAAVGARDAIVTSEEYKKMTSKAKEEVDKLVGGIANLNQEMSTGSYDIYASGMYSAVNATGTLTNATNTLVADTKTGMTNIGVYTSQSATDIQNLARSVSGMGNIATSAMQGFSNNLQTFDFSRASGEIMNKLTAMGDAGGRSFTQAFYSYMVPTGMSQMRQTLVNTFQAVANILVNDGTIYNHFYMMGQAIASAINAGISANIGNIVTTIMAQMNYSSLIGTVNTLVGKTNTMQTQIQQIQNILNAGSGGGSGGGGGGNRAMMVNEKNVNMNVTINQTTPTNVVDNIRYAQALANSKIY